MSLWPLGRAGCGEEGEAWSWWCVCVCVCVCVCTCMHTLGEGLEEPQPQLMGFRGPMLRPQIAPSGAQTGMCMREILLVSA